MTTYAYQVDDGVVAASGSIDGLRARVITRSGDLQVLTYVRVEDTRSALARGLKEYLEPLKINWSGGRLLKFEQAIVHWAEPEVPQKYPALSIVGNGPGNYDDSEFVGRLEKIGDGTERYITTKSELKQSFSLIIWANEKAARSGLTAMLEDALEPSDIMSGLRLELPYYFGARSTFEKLSVTYNDDSTSAQRNLYKATISLMGNIPQIVARGGMPTFADTGPRLDLTVKDGNTPHDGVLAVSPEVTPDTGAIEGVVIKDARAST